MPENKYYQFFRDVVQLCAFGKFGLVSRGFTMQYLSLVNVARLRRASILAILFAAVVSPRAEARLVVRDWLTADFFVDHDSKEHPHFQYLVEPDLEADCRARIRDIVCLVDPSTTGEPAELVDTRPCLEGGSAYAKHFEALYDRFPAALQKSFCSLGVIFVEKESAGASYAGLKVDREGHVVGARLGLRKAKLDEQGASEFVQYAVAHGFAHILDYMNGLHTSSWDEFADSLALYVSDRDKVSTTKARYLEKVLSRGDLRYP